MKKIIFGFILLSALAAEARWECTVICDRAVTTELGRIERHASGDDFADFEAECRQKGGVTNGAGNSNCGYAYCTSFSKYQETLSGFGSTLTEARKSARSTCYNEPLEHCGGGNKSGWIDESSYNCRER